MKIIFALLTTISLFKISNSTAQRSFENDNAFKEAYASQREKFNVQFFNDKNVFELRVWIKSAVSSPNLLRLTLSDDSVWKAEKFIIKKNRNKESEKKSTVKLGKEWPQRWKEMVQKKVLTMPDQEEVKANWEAPLEIVNGDTLKNILVIGSGVTYHFEVLSAKAKRYYSYYCPFSNKDFYKNESELQAVVRILEILLKQFEYKEPSC